MTIEMMRVPFFQHARHDSAWRNKLSEIINATVAHGQYILGPEVTAFETDFANYCGASSCVGVGNGCDALYFILQALDIGADDEILVPANTFIGTILPILRVGARPIFVDCSRISFNIDASLIRSKITPKTKAIIPVHLYGRPAPMQEILALASEYNLKVIEDAAQSQGAHYKGKRAGNIAEYASFSFYPSKNLGAMGDAGAIVTSDLKVSERISCLRNYGQRVKYRHDFDGWNSRLDTIQAAILSHKLKVLDSENASRRQLAAEYLRNLAGLPLHLPTDEIDTEPVYHLFVILSEFRDELASFLKGKGIDTGIHYPIPCTRQKVVLDQLGPLEPCPEADWQSERLLSLPMFPEMKTEAVQYVCSTIRDYFNQK